MEGGIFLTEMERISAFGNTSWTEERCGFREVYEAVRGVAVIQFVVENGVDGAVREVFHERVAESRRFAQGVGEMHSRRRGESAVDRNSAVDISHSEVRRNYSETVRGFI